MHDRSLDQALAADLWGDMLGQPPSGQLPLLAHYTSVRTLEPGQRVRVHEER